MSEYYDEDTVIRSGEIDTPNWEFGTDEELREHAAKVVAETADALNQLTNDPARPVATAPHSIIQLPCPDRSNLARQVVYLGWVAELCRLHSLLVRDIGTRGDADHTAVCVAICTLADYQRSELESEQGERFLH